MLPLALSPIGEKSTIKKVGGKTEVKTHLENLGFVTGGEVTIIARIGGNVIVSIKNSRIAISKEMAGKILV